MLQQDPHPSPPPQRLRCKAQYEGKSVSRNAILESAALLFQSMLHGKLFEYFRRLERDVNLQGPGNAHVFLQH